MTIHDPGGKLLLARRSSAKKLWPGCWDGTVASHPLPGQSYELAASIRVVEELGVPIVGTEELEPLGKFRYEESYGSYSEKEVCKLFRMELEDLASIEPDKAEVSSLKVVKLDEIGRMPITPWLERALEFLRTGSQV